MTMKRILSAALALTLLGTTAASAHGWDRGGYGGYGGYGGGYHHRNGGDGAALGFGLGILALGLIAAQSSRHHDRYRDRDGYYDRNYDRDRYRDRDRYGDRDRGYDDNGY